MSYLGFRFQLFSYQIDCNMKTRTPDVRNLSSQYTGEITTSDQETDENKGSL